MEKELFCVINNKNLEKLLQFWIVVCYVSFYFIYCGLEIIVYNDLDMVCKLLDQNWSFQK